MNFCLFLVKIYAAIESFSLSVIASAVDSLLDLCSGSGFFCMQGVIAGHRSVIFFTSKIKARTNIEKYPVGKSRIGLHTDLREYHAFEYSLFNLHYHYPCAEPLGVVVFAAIMGTAALQIIRESINTFIATEHVPPKPAIGAFVVIGATIVTKVSAGLLWATYHSICLGDSFRALPVYGAQQHLRDGAGSGSPQRCPDQFVRRPGLYSLSVLQCKTKVYLFCWMQLLMLPGGWIQQAHAFWHATLSLTGDAQPLVRIQTSNSLRFATSYCLPHQHSFFRMLQAW